MDSSVVCHSENYFTELAKYYDVTHQWRDYDKQAAFLLDIVEKYRPSCARILDLGCGTGEHARRLCAAGHRVTGMDSSDEMLAIAASKTLEASPRPEWVLSNFMTSQESNIFDVAYCLGMTVHYVYSPDGLIFFLSKVRDMLTLAGIFVLDIINPWHMLEWAPVAHRYSANASQQIHVLERTEIDRSLRIRHNEYTWFVKDTDYAWHQHKLFENLKIWFIDEIEYSLDRAGLVLAKKCSNYELTRLDLRSDFNVAFVTRKG